MSVLVVFGRAICGGLALVATVAGLPVLAGDVGNVDEEALLRVAAEAHPPAFNEVPRCKIDTDPYAVPAYVHGLLPGEGRNGPPANPKAPRLPVPLDVGHCVAQDQYRPVMALTNEESEIYGFNAATSTGRRIVANVRDVDGWYTASIPSYAATDIYFNVNIRQMPVLGKRGGHSEARVFFSEPVILTPQWPLAPWRQREVYDLVFTANPTGINSAAREDPVRAFDGSMLQARGIQTREARLYLSFVKAFTYTVHQYKMKMNPGEIAAYVNAYLERATKTRLTQRFMLVGTNCSSSQFEILDRVLWYRYRLLQLPFDPNFAHDRLVERGLVDGNSEVIPFEEEPWAKEIFAKYGRHAAPQG